MEILSFSRKLGHFFNFFSYFTVTFVPLPDVPLSLYPYYFRNVTIFCTVPCRKLPAQNAVITGNFLPVRYRTVITAKCLLPPVLPSIREFSAVPTLPAGLSFFKFQTPGAYLKAYFTLLWFESWMTARVWAPNIPIAHEGLELLDSAGRSVW